MIDIDLTAVAEFRHHLRIFIGCGLLLAFLIPWGAAIYDGIKGRK